MENGDKMKFTEDIATLKSEMNFVKKQVSNHIPTSISEMVKSNKEEHINLRDLINNVSDKVQGINLKLAYWAGAIAVVIILMELVINKYL